MDLKIVADMHTHSNISKHAASTIEENCSAAAEKKLITIAATDHGPVVDDAPDSDYFDTMNEWLPRSMFGVNLLHGIEANILNSNGETDIDPLWGGKLDFGIASIPTGYFHGTDFDEFTNAYWRVLDNPYVDLLGHMGTVFFECDYEAIIKKCARVGKLIEINASSFRHRLTSIPNCIKIAKLCKKHSAKIMVNSDAHSKDQVGFVKPALDMLEEIDFPEELITNSSEERLSDYLNNRRRA